jgi:SAM-dependent methyltransferase
VTPATGDLPDFRPAPNQGENAALYELENRAVDNGGLVLAAMYTRAPWRGRTIVDLGCGSGYWLTRYTEEAARVVGVEPDPRLLPLAAQRDPRAEVLRGSAEHIPLSDASVDVIHARFAYFFPPGCEPGLAEAMRVLRPGGTLIVVDNDLRHGEFATLLRASPWAAAQGGGDPTDAWWAEHGADRQTVHSQWRFAQRDHLEAVLRMEFPADVADQWLSTHPDSLGLSYSYALFAIDKPGIAKPGAGEPS